MEYIGNVIHNIHPIIFLPVHLHGAPCNARKDFLLPLLPGQICGSSKAFVQRQCPWTNDKLTLQKLPFPAGDIILHILVKFAPTNPNEFFVLKDLVLGRGSA